MRYEDLSLEQDITPAQNSISRILKHKPNNHLVLVYGAAGVGKTFFGQSIAKEMRAVFLDKETLCLPLTNVLVRNLNLPPNSTDSSIYKVKVLPYEYKVLIDTAIDNFKAGQQTVVCSAPFIDQLSDRVWYAKLLTQLSRVEAKLSLVWITANPDFNYSLLASRREERDQWRLNNWHEYQETIPKAPVNTIGRSSLVVQNNAKVSYSNDIKFRQIVKQIVKRIT